MNAQCHHCKTVFRVDPRRVPPGGARARCSICRNVFQVAPPATAVEAAVPAPAAPRAEPAPTPAPAPAATPPVAPPPAPTPAAPAAPAPAAAAPAARPNPFAFGANDPGAKARRLARALVSDIVMYHPEKRDQALAAGTLKREFMDEIKKSWEEYVAQVGPETAKGTPHFRDALNDILAKGQALF